MKHRITAGMAVLALLVLIAANLAILIKTTRTLDLLSRLPAASQPLPCPAIPTRLILEDPVCAQKLLDAMNVTGVRVDPRDTAVPRTNNASVSGKQHVPGAGAEW